MCVDVDVDVYVYVYVYVCGFRCICVSCDCCCTILMTHISILTRAFKRHLVSVAVCCSVL